MITTTDMVMITDMATVILMREDITNIMKRNMDTELPSVIVILRGECLSLPNRPRKHQKPRRRETSMSMLLTSTFLETS